MSTLEPRVVYQGSTEDIAVEVSATVTLNAQTVSFSFDGGATWKTAAWSGTAAKVRTATLTVNTGNLPTFPFDVVMLVKIDSTIKPGLSRRVQGRVIPA